MKIREQALELIQQATGSRSAVVCPRPFVEMLDGDLNAAIVLNQILYWSERTSHPDGWFYKSYKEWREELSMSAYQVRRVVWGDPRVQQPHRTLQDVGVEVSLKRAPNGSPTVHYRIDQAVFFAALTEHLEQLYTLPTADQIDAPCSETSLHTVANENATMLTMESQQCAPSSYTEISTENPSETTIIPPTPPDDDELTREFDHMQQRFGKLKNTIRDSLSKEKKRLGRSRVHDVIGRCVGKGRSWAYVLAALANEQDDPLTKPNPEPLKIPVELPGGGLVKAQIIPEKPSFSTSEHVMQPWTRIISGATIRDAWDIALNQLELQLDRASFDRCLRGAVLVDFDSANSEFVAVVRSASAREMLAGRLYRRVQRVLSDVYGAEAGARFIAPEQTAQTAPALPAAEVA